MKIKAQFPENEPPPKPKKSKKKGSLSPKSPKSGTTVNNKRMIKYGMNIDKFIQLINKYVDLDPEKQQKLK